MKSSTSRCDSRHAVAEHDRLKWGLVLGPGSAKCICPRVWHPGRRVRRLAVGNRLSFPIKIQCRCVEKIKCYAKRKITNHKFCGAVCRRMEHSGRDRRGSRDQRAKRRQQCTGSSALAAVQRHKGTYKRLKLPLAVTLPTRRSLPTANTRIQNMNYLDSQLVNLPRLALDLRRPYGLLDRARPTWKWTSTSSKSSTPQMVSTPARGRHCHRLSAAKP